MNLGGIEVVSCPYAPQTIPEQFRFPRSKKVRIRKKWRKDQRNWRETSALFLIAVDPAFGPHSIIALGNSAVLKNFQPVL